MRLISALLLSALISMSLSCTKKESEPTTQNAQSTSPVSGGTLIFARPGDSVGLDPAHETDGESFKVTNNIYEGLVEFKRGSTELKPGLAESWEITPDGINYIFNLRKGVKFHDGTDFNADAVLFTFNRQLKAEHPFHKVGGAWKYWESMGMSDILKSVEKIDDHKVKFTLNRPESPFLSNLAMDFTVIVSPTAAKLHGEAFSQHPVGTGPFKFAEWQKNQKIVVTRNETYWGKKAFLQSVIFKAIPDPSVRLLEFSAGSVDMMDYPNPEDITVLEKRSDTKILKRPGMNIAYLALNMDKKPFDNPLVRKAINHAINRKDIVEHVYNGLAVEAKNPIPPIIWGYNDEIIPYDHNPEKARQLLKQAGLEKGFKTTLWAIPVSRPYNPNGRKMAEIIQSDLRKIGVDANIVTFEWGTYLKKTSEGEHDMVLLGWTGDNGDPDNFLFVLLDKTSAKKPAQNLAFYRSDKLHSILTRAKTNTDRKVRESLYKEAQSVIHEDAPWVTIAHGVEVLPIKNHVHGFVMDPTGKRRFKGTWVTK